jgi:hypothetical protein
MTPALAQSAASVTLDAPPVFDPKLDDGKGGHPSLTVTSATTGAGSVSATLTVQDGQGNSVRSFPASTQTAGTSWTTSWDGTSDAGTTVSPGTYVCQLAVQGASNGTAQRVVNVVRLGARSMTFQDAGVRVPLTYHATNGTARSYFAIDSAGDHWNLPQGPSAGALDDGNGNPLVAPAPWAALATPPVDPSGNVLARGRAFPLAYPINTSALHAQVTLGDTAVNGDGSTSPCNYPIQGVDIRVRAGGAPSSPIAPGSQATLEVATTLPGTLTKATLPMALNFECNDGSGWRAIPGQQTASLTLYTVLGAAQTADQSNTSTPDARQQAFVAALDEVVGWASQTPVATSADALALITRTVNGGKGLTYDVVSGAPAYADGDPGTPSLAFSELLNGESRGNVVNCADCAAIVGVYSRTVGVDVQSAVLGSNFRLNYILGIGATEWKEAIFTSGGASFSFHAVATVDGGASVYDACLAVDDGPHPDQMEPRVQALPLAMPFDHYMSKLTSDSFSIQELGRPTQN